MKQLSYKAALEACYGREVSTQEAFNALLEQTELIRVLDRIDRSLGFSVTVAEGGIVC